MKKYIFGGIVLVVAGLLLGFALFGQSKVSVPAPVPVEQAPLGDANQNSTYSFNVPVCHGSSGTVICEDWVGGKIGPQQNQAFYKNTSGAKQYIDLTDVSTDGVASSTYKIYAVATSSALSLAYNFTAPVATSSYTLINGFQFATSSIATTTSSLDPASQGGAPGNKVIQLPAGWQISIYLLSTGGAGCKSQAATCESATSTNRGFNLFWRAHVHN